MTTDLNLADIQGNVPRAYGRYSFPFARYFFFRIERPAQGRKFVEAVRRRVTTATPWAKGAKPDCTTNIAFTFMGLWMLELPVRTLQGMPEEFAEGMKARAFILGDRDQTLTEDEARQADWCRHWDPIWQENRRPGGKGEGDVHIWVSLNAQAASASDLTNPHPELQARTDWLMGLPEAIGGGVTLIAKNGKTGDQPYQSGSAVFQEVEGMMLPTPKEHFGFTDGIGNPVFEGQYGSDPDAMPVIGNGKLVKGKDGRIEWQPLATGEFLLGHPDESQELPPTSTPPEFMHNGTFMAYRKLHENVSSFREVVDGEAARFARVMEVPPAEARETVLAKMCGRWSDGVPLSKVPTYGEWRAFQVAEGWGGDKAGTLAGFRANLAYIGSSEAADFRYADDMAGLKCPVGAHLRRVNTRDMLDPMNQAGIDPETGAQPENPAATSALNNRRRILRRGLPYGGPKLGTGTDETEQGVVMMILGANLFRQFEFVQQQWIQYGLDFNEGNNTCPLLGNHGTHKLHPIASDPSSGKPPYVMSTLKTFVECRGGDYFFIPSMTGLRMIAMGIVDPT
ncbi:peroxidase [Poseidonocella sp. HB161398]|uniref:peroxidase n=1 Tax=Poseidonocella sp. HB161398 TaxID=2320855 RepID=UPI001108D77A|nr:peroxidase [Poseidonocella sp. HB161398]